jgi:hypothetical protein
MMMARNIVVFSDGTGQEGGEGHNTNVYKLFNMVEDRTARQVAFYDRGLGTGWRKITGNGAGMGISENIQECYQFIFENYEAQYLFIWFQPWCGHGQELVRFYTFIRYSTEIKTGTHRQGIQNIPNYEQGQKTLRSGTIYQQAPYHVVPD